MYSILGKSDMKNHKDVLDMDKLKDSFMGDLNIIKQILSAFQDTIQDFEKEFKSLEDSGNQTELSRLVHGLKGSSANIRAENVSIQAANLQQRIEQNEDYTDDVNPLLESIALLEQEINKIKAQ